MSRSFRFVLAVAMLAACTASIAYFVAREPEIRAAAGTGDSMAWLKAEFQLTASQAEKIGAVHFAYTQVCAEHCEAILDAVEEKNRVFSLPSASEAERSSAENRLAALTETCERAIEVHVRQVAAMMSPGQGERYLQVVLPAIASFDHRTAWDSKSGRHTH